MKRTLWLVRTALCLALLIALQFLTRSLGQLVTGSCVNFVLAMASLTGGVWCGLVVAALSPFFAYALGIGPAFLQLVPCVALGNVVYALAFALLLRSLLAKRRWLAALPGLALAAAVKFAVLWLVLVRIVAPLIVPAAKLSVVTAAFTWPQLLTAAVGGAVACAVWPVIDKALRAPRS